MKPTGTNTKVEARSTAPHGGHWVYVFMLLGLFLLVAGCREGVADAQARTTVLSLLSGGISMFATALVLHARFAHHAASLLSPAAVDPKPVAVPIAKQPDVAVREVQMSPHVADEVGLAADHAPAGDLTCPAGDTPVASMSDQPTFDVATLMGAPLTDLLLAAMCKDPVGARRIFARALETQPTSVEQATSTTSRQVANAPPPSKSDSPAPASATKSSVAP